VALLVLATCCHAQLFETKIASGHAIGLEFVLPGRGRRLFKFLNGFMRLLEDAKGPDKLIGKLKGFEKDSGTYNGTWKIYANGSGEAIHVEGAGKKAQYIFMSAPRIMLQVQIIAFWFLAGQNLHMTFMKWVEVHMAKLGCQYR